MSFERVFGESAEANAEKNYFRKSDRLISDDVVVAFECDNFIKPYSETCRSLIVYTDLINQRHMTELSASL